MRLSIIHNPLGLEHPYEQGPCERVPRYPESGDEVRINWRIEPEPEGGLSEVLLTSDEGEVGISGEQIDGSEKGASWTALLPPADSSYSYSIRFRPAGSEEEGAVISEMWNCLILRELIWDRLIDNRIEGDRLILSFLSAERSAPVSRIFRFFEERVEHCIAPGKGGGLCPESKPAEPFAFGNAVSPVENSDREVVFRAGSWLLRADKETGLVSLLRNGEFIFVDTVPLRGLVDDDHSVLKLELCRRSTGEEGFYGFGERFNSLDQRGNRLDVRVFEEYKKQDEGGRTYIPVPFYFTDQGRGAWADSCRRVSYDLDTEETGEYRMNVETGFISPASGRVENGSRSGASGPLFTEHLFCGTPADIVKSFQSLTAFPVMPPEWIFTPWMSGNEWNSQKRVMEVWEKSRELDIPAGVLVIEAWSDEKNFYIWNDAEFEPKSGEECFNYSDFTFPAEGLWPDPKGMIENLHKGGTKLILWQIPLLKALNEDESASEQRDRDEAYMKEKEYCVRHEDGTPYTVRPWWFTHSLAPDFTNPEAVKWWMGKRRYLVEELGVDGFKTDGGEHLWGHSLKFGDGRSGDELWNEYPLLYEKGYYELVNGPAARKKGEGVVFSRSGFTGAAASPIHWTGDQDSTWEAHRSVLKAVLNAGLSGIPFIGWDIGGFSGEIPTAELYLRSAAMACFSPLMQYHSELNGHKKPVIDRTPWNIAEQRKAPEVISIYRFFAWLRMALGEYLVTEARWTCESGTPLMRPLFYDYPEDKTAWACDDQYLLGRDLVVAPILFEGSKSREVFLPSGEWQDFWTGSSIEGGPRFSVEVPLDRIPVFCRPGSPVSSIKIPASGEEA